MSNPTVCAARSVWSSALSNSQARSPSPHHGRRRARDRRRGAIAATEQLDQISQAPTLGGLGDTGLDRVADLLELRAVDAACKQRQPFDQKLAVRRRVGQLQRIETGGVIGRSRS